MAGLGVAWILDGLEVTIVGALGPRLQERVGLGLSASQVGLAASSYLAGAVGGALGFGFAADRLGRSRIFLVTLGWYVVATLATAISWNFASFASFRFATGIGIGGEYAAINSAIDELIPARRRGAVDLAVNGTWWLGTIVGSAASLVLLDPRLIDPRLGWRLAFAGGALLALAALFVRRTLPESPRWLVARGRATEAERVLARFERAAAGRRGAPAADLEGTARAPSLESPHDVASATRAAPATDLATVARTLLQRYPKRTLVALALMVSQAFLYNAIFFTEALVLATFFGVPSGRVGLYIFPFALGNLLGPLVLGPLFDRIGRKPMIALTYLGSSALLVATGLLFVRGWFDATTIALAWSLVFFFASAGASAAYLTASEIFPLATRSSAIALIYAFGTLAGGVAAPALFGALIATHTRGAVFAGYLVGAALMAAAGLVELWFGIEAARRPLEEIAP